jgi:acetoacetyl-CoA synthetase
MSKLLWQPSDQRIAAARITEFQNRVSDQFSLTLSTYDDLWQWSIDQPDQFWDSVCNYLNIEFSQPAKEVLQAGKGIRDARWFEGARLNFARHLLKRRDDHIAIVFRGENGTRRSLTYAELYQQVAEVQSYLKKMNIRAGDRVAGYLPNSSEAIIAMLATTALGGVWTSCSPDFGINGVVDRFGQVEPKLLFTVDGYHYAGKPINNLDKLPEIVARIPSVDGVVVYPFLNDSPDIKAIKGAQLWADALDDQACNVDFVELPFDHPLYILYSSGTTGVPKCIVHGAGGTLLQHMKELALHTDLGPDSRLMYFTTCGWMMWNWMVSGLAVGASLVLFDGSPFHPAPSSLWDIVEQEEVTAFGTSAKYIAAIQNADYLPNQHHTLTQLNSILSTGSPLSPESFEFIYDSVKRDLHLASISGGTDIVSCFALGVPTLPVYSGELQARGLGMAVDIYDDEGNSLVEEKGELVCTTPFPSRPIGFWNDPQGDRYKAAYFDRFENVWAHGDYAELTERNGLIIHGRSDAVLNPGGVRIGTAEIYRQVEKVAGVTESICVGLPKDDDVVVALYVVLAQGIELTDELVTEIKSTIRKNTTPRHVPGIIKAVADIPRTKSGKIVELAVRNVLIGEPVKNRESLANPEALELFEGLGV